MVVLKYPEGRYEGDVDEKGEPSGEGVLEFPGNDELERMIYEGGFAGKKAHGKGVLRWREGDRYDGDFVNGVREGFGTYLSKASNGKYEGHYKDDQKHGQGTYTYGNGDVYSGQWSQGVREGLGTYVYKDDGGKFEGEWRNGKKNGRGKYTYANGDVFEGIYEDNERNGEGCLLKKEGERRNELWKQGKLVSFQVVG